MKLIYRCFCAVLGAILGSGCSDSSEPVEYGPMPEYGVPSGTVRVDGRAIDALGAPIPGIVVGLPVYGEYADLDTTDAAGRFDLEASGVRPCPLDSDGVCTVKAADIDGPANGGPYPVATAPLDLQRTVPGSGSWDLGTWEQHGLDILMDDAAEYGPPPAPRQR